MKQGRNLPCQRRTNIHSSFLSSGDTIKAYINQESGKAIQSVDKQDILGEWLLRGVFQLAEREVLTGKKLESLEINGIRLTKFKMAKSVSNLSGLIRKIHQQMR